MARFTNAWRNVSFEPAAIVAPPTVEALVDLVRRTRAEGGRLKAVGGRHSMNHILHTEGTIVDVSALSGIRHIDVTERTVTMGAGTRLSDAIVALARVGLHFPSLGSWHSQTIAGAIATSTHGSSLVHGSFSDIVVAAKMVLLDGTVASFSGEDETMKAVRCHLGQLGILVEVTLKVVPAFYLACRISTQPMEAALASLLRRAREHEYVNMLWIPDLDEVYTRILERVDAERPNGRAAALKAKFVDRSRLSLRLEDIGFFLVAHAYQIVPRWLSRWYCGKVRDAFFDDDGVVDVSYRQFLYDKYREPTENHSLRTILNVEYAFDIEAVVPLLTALRTLLATQRSAGRYLNYPRVHIRFAAASGETLVGLNAERVTAYVGIYVLGSVRGRRQAPLGRAVEREFLAYGGRPHWGKFSYLAPALTGLPYRHWDTFAAIRQRLDPDGVFQGEPIFEDLDTFDSPKIGQMLRSIFDSDEYETIRDF
ncbi:D-arabinono-1,4-lactone oxidase [Acuticoccus sediminis]|uniref:D-arabinono-1,4-lactone oxidase n=1 Tax=Acuticoccus sediminis TaxID=2184697 RepID=UPI001CFCD830|nr:D-arabinono-1,4-lactone oxidase [Acuticoccus sediminis]